MTPTDAAVASLRAALDEKYPGEWLDPTALCAVLDELKRLRALEQRAIEVRDGGRTKNSVAIRAAKFILDGED